MGEIRNANKILILKLKGRRHLGDLNISLDKEIILK
jgi:hypothetical protein